MSLHRVINCLLAALIALLLSSSYLLDGPSEIDAMRAVQASKQDAIKSAATHAQRTWARGQKDHQFMLAKAAP